MLCSVGRHLFSPLPSPLPFCFCLRFLFLHANERSHIDLASSFMLLWQQYKNY